MADGGKNSETGEVKKVTKWFTSLMAERAWLEEMSLAGWFLMDLRMGIRYTFEKGEPKRTAYDVERFDLAKSPTRREIQEKSDLMAMAAETGWRFICKDEGQNYYLAKRWEAEETNEFYDSPEDRASRARQYGRMFSGKIHTILWVCMIMQGFGFLFWLFPEEDGSVGWFPVFVMLYTASCLAFCLILLRWKQLYDRELRMSLEEWRSVYGKKDTVRKFRVIITLGGLERYLEKQAAAGYHLKNMQVFHYTFSKREAEEVSYMMDTRYLTNRRRKRAGSSIFKDSRDWEERSNDWQVQSLMEAEASGWEFVTAVESRNILYRAKAGSAVPLNESGGIRLTSAFGGMAMLMIKAGLIGGFIGALAGYFLG